MIAKIGASIVLVAMCVSCARSDNPKLPPKANALINKVSNYASERNYDGLSSVMSDPFSWSFGRGGSDKALALKAFREDSERLNQLAKVSNPKLCRVVSDGIPKNQMSILCPSNPGTGWRASYGLKDGKWSLDFFLAGD